MEELETHYRKLHKMAQDQDVSFDVSRFVMQQFSNFFNSYAKAYNKRYERRGALFIGYVRRALVEDEFYFTNLVRYIHQNPVHHGFCKNAEDWAFSSLHSIISHKKTNLERNVVLDWFGGIEKFIAFQKKPKEPLTGDLEFNKF